MKMTRREFLGAGSGFLGAAVMSPWAGAAEGLGSLAGEVGVTTGSFMRHITFEPAAGKLRLLDLPKLMRDELDMRVIDLMTRTMESFEPAYLDKLRQAAEENGCVLTNLKCNQPGLDMASADGETRAHALKIYRESIDAAERLGCRWVRPLAGAGKGGPDRELLAESYRELIEYGGPKGISLLIENTGWVANDAEAMPDMIGRVGEGLDASPDTGNWADDTIRYEGLAKAYPLAVTSDFKVFEREADGSHPKYDLRRCFDAGWDAGYRGPWCMEHFNKELPGLMAGFGEVRDELRGWISGRAG
jgi:hypothetical protein